MTGHDVLIPVCWPFYIAPELVLPMTELFLIHRAQHLRLTRDAMLRRAFFPPAWGYLSPLTFTLEIDP